MNRRVVIVGALVVIPLLVFLAIGFRYDPRTIESPLVGKPAPGFTLVDLNGAEVSLEELRGQPVVINFWATWCQPCIAEHGLLQQAAQIYQGRVHFLGIIYQDEERQIRRFLESRGSWGPSLVDPGSEVAIAYGVYGAPETYVLDADGLVFSKITGMLTWDSLSSALEQIT